MFPSAFLRRALCFVGLHRREKRATFPKITRCKCCPWTLDERAAGYGRTSDAHQGI